MGNLNKQHVEMPRVTNTVRSRREVQRRFPPGSFLLDGEAKIYGTVIGWAPVAAEKMKTYTIPARWEVLVLRSDCTLTRLNWSILSEKMTDDEWLDWYTSP